MRITRMAAVLAVAAGLAVLGGTPANAEPAQTLAGLAASLPAVGGGATTTVPVGMTVTGFDASVARAHGYKVTKNGPGSYTVTKNGTSEVISFPSSASDGSANSPDLVVNGNCGQSFLYLSRVNGVDTRATYGFQNLVHSAVSYNAYATFYNWDTGYSTSDWASGNLFFRTSWQRTVTKWTGSGEVYVYPTINAVMYTGATCQSASTLYDAIYVY